jgi:stage II sporulation protein D
VRPFVLLSAALLLGATVTPAHAEAPRAEPASVTFTTMGNGHGKGLSQYGARNRANDGQTYRQIVDHYYPGTTWGTAAGSVRVLVSADTSSDVVVLARTGLAAKSLGSGKSWKLPAKRDGRKVVRWRLAPASGHKTVLSYRTKGWHTYRTGAGDAEFSAGGAAISLVTPTKVVRYRGVLRSAAVNAAGSARDTVNVLPLDSYLKGVVPREVPGLWPAAAVRAQAIAARTYAAYERAAVPAGRYYDLCDTAHCQVYGGYDAEHPGANAAVTATARQVLTYDGEPAFTQFSASNGGYSAAGDFPYLVAEWDPYDHGYPGAPADPLERTFSGDQITRHWVGLGDLVSVEVLTRDTDGTHEGHVLTVRVTGTEGSVTATGTQLQSYLGLRSSLFRTTQL